MIRGSSDSSGGRQAGVELGEVFEVFRAGCDVGFQAADDVGPLVFRGVKVFQPRGKPLLAAVPVHEAF